MQLAWQLVALVAAAGGVRLQRVALKPPPHASSRGTLRRPLPALQLRLRGGAEDGASDPSRAVAASEAEEAPLSPLPDADVPLPTPAAAAATAAAEAPPAATGCWAVLGKVWRLLLSLLSPSHEYAKQDHSDLLGDATQTAGFAPDDESWRTQRKRLHQVELPPPARKRVLRDLRRLKASVDLGLFVDDAECLTDWVVRVTGANKTIYAGEIYRLRVRFSPEYPLRPPEVRFLRPAPVHEHIYSDGKICLNILYGDWKPEMDVQSMCLSLVSMLSSATKKSRPPDNNQTVVLTQGQQAGSMQWDFHDDNC